MWYNVWIPLRSCGEETATFLDQADLEIRQLVMTITLGPGGPEDPVEQRMGAHDEVLSRLLVRLPNLRAVHSAHTSPKLLEVIEKLPIDTLSLLLLTRPIKPICGLRRLELMFSSPLAEGDLSELHEMIKASADKLEHLDLGVSGPMSQPTLQESLFPSSSDPPLALPLLHTLYIRAPKLDPSFFAHLSIAAPNLQTLNAPMDDIHTPVQLDIPAGSFPDLARLEIGLPPLEDGSLTGIEKLVKGKMKLELMTLHVSAVDSLAIVEAASESPQLTQLILTETTPALLRQIGLSLPNLVHLEFNDILPATSGTGGDRDFEYVSS